MKLPKKVLSRDSNDIADLGMWSMFANSSISMRKVFNFMTI